MARKRQEYSNAELFGAGLAFGGTAIFGYMVIWPLARKGLLREDIEPGTDEQRLHEGMISYSLATIVVAVVIDQTVQMVEKFLKTGELPEVLP